MDFKISKRGKTKLQLFFSKLNTDLALSLEEPEWCCLFLGRPGPRCLSLQSIIKCHFNLEHSSNQAIPLLIMMVFNHGIFLLLSEFPSILWQHIKLKSKNTQNPLEVASIFKIDFSQVSLFILGYLIFYLFLY